MRLGRWKHLISWTVLGTMLPGCSGTKNVHYLGDAELKYYKNYVQAIEYPNVDQATPPEVVISDRPRTVKDRTEDEIWDLTLMDAIHAAIANNKLIRTRSQFLTQSALLTNPANSPSIYDPALRETGFLFGSRGVEAALSDFDAQVNATAVWGRSENVQNSQFFGANQAAGQTLVQETATVGAGISKNFANGGLFSVNHYWNYLGTNQPSVLFPSSYNGYLQAQYRHPLLAGAGTEFTRIAGPISRSFGGISGVTQGVLIARINTDITIADFETNVFVMVRDVENLYWDLYLAYRQYDAEVANRDSALRSWREVKAKMEVGASGGNAGAEAQARENYFDTRARVESALSNIYNFENQFRRLIGLPVNDGRVIRPADNPLEGEYLVNWEVSLTEALIRRPELRRQKWQIKSLELQCLAAKSLTRPRLDFVSSYQVNGFGDKLISQSNNDGVTDKGYHSAYGSLTRGDETSWQTGFEMTMPIGFRAAYAQLRNTELQLMKARSALAAQELDISHELADAIQTIDVSYMTARTYFDRRIAAERRVEATQAEYEAGVRDATLDLVLRAQASRSAAEIQLYSALVRYNQAITDLHMRKGTLLENNGISLMEGPWTGHAHEEALRRAWARSYGWDAPLLNTEPAEFSSPVPYGKTDLTWPGLGADAGLSPAPSPGNGGGPVPPSPQPDSQLSPVPAPAAEE